MDIIMKTIPHWRGITMKKYRVSRFRQLIWPQELFVDKFHVLAKKRHFPSFWRVTEESIPLSKVASIQIHRGFLFSKIIIENSGGPFPITVNGLWNSQASNARHILEKIEQEMRNSVSNDILDLIDEDDDSGDDGLSPDIDPKIPPQPAAKKFEPVLNGVKAIARKVKAKASRRPALTQRKLPVDEIVDNVYYGESPTNYDDNWDFGEEEHVPNVVKYNQEHPPSEDMTAAAEDFQVRKVGQIDEDWNPPPPWAPKAGQPKEFTMDDEQPLREIDPITFLSENAESASKPKIRKPDNSRRAARFNFDVEGRVEGLVNFWNRTREEVTSAVPKSNRRILK